MRTIVVSGSHSGIGKTRLVEEMLHSLPDWSAIKTTVIKSRSRCPRNNDCEACSDLKGDFDVISDKKIVEEKHTDTARMKAAGAKEVVWLKANLKGLRMGLKKSLDFLKDSKGVVIEGTSVLRYIKPDLTIYLKGNSRQTKSGIREVQRKADIIIDCINIYE